MGEEEGLFVGILDGEGEYVVEVGEIGGVLVGV